MIVLRKESTADEIASALREAGVPAPDPDEEFGGRKLVSDLASEHVELPGSAVGGPFDDVIERVEAWVLSWRRTSWSTGRSVEGMVAVIDRSLGGLPAGGDGFAATERFVVKLPRREDLDLAMEVVARRCVPELRAYEEM